MNLKRALLFILTCYLFFHCSEDLSTVVDDILLTVDKNVALSEGDTVRIMTEVHNHIDERLSGIPLTYYANDTKLDGPVFYPTAKGSYVIRAEYEDVVSKGQRVEVISLEDNITSLELRYEGNPWLTTEPWSMSGAFSFDVQVDNLNFQVSTRDITLLLDGSPVSDRSGFQFDQPGEYEFTAAFSNLQSQPITLHVREKLDLPEVTIPVIFHFYNLDIQQDQVRKLIDTLNSSFNISAYDPVEVMEGEVNPNAVNINVRFEEAMEAPDGFVLTAPGVHVIRETIPGNLFSEIALANTWDPERYVNVWLADGQIDLEENLPDNYEFQGRGIVSQPMVFDREIPGLVTLPEYTADPVAGIVVNAGSVFNEHPDYIVASMAHYFGLFITYGLECRHEGDYVADTPTIDFSREAPTNFFRTCENVLFRPSNFLSINRNYRDFTYDQALRMREVIEYGISRPGGN